MARRQSRCDGRAGRNRRAGRTADPGSTLRRRSGSRIRIGPGRVGSPGRQRRNTSGAPRATVTGSAVRKPFAESATSSGSVSGSSRIGQNAEDDVGLDAPREGDALFGEPRRKTIRGPRRPPRRAAPRLLSSQDGLAGGGDDRHFKVNPKRKARGRDGRWTVIPGAYVSRWAPCTQAQGRGQGQLPLGSYGPGDVCPDEPRSSATPI